ncbi:hypothetical protein Tco_0386253 [Tanacetum coccineum]
MDTAYGRRNARRSNRNQIAAAGNGMVQQIEANDHIILRVPRTESNPRKPNGTNVAGMKDEAGGNLNEEEDDFMLDNDYGDDTMKDLNVAVIKMAHIQPAENKADVEPKHDAETISDVIVSQINPISGICSENEHDSNVHDQSVAFESLIYNVKKEATNKRRLNNELNKQKALLQKELKTYKKWVKTLEKKPVQSLNYKEAYKELE